jgi:hypothetical protein
MIWIFGAVLIVLAILSPGFRKFGLALTGAAIIVIVILIVINERGEPNPAPLAADSKPPAAGNRMMDHDEYVIERQDKIDPEAKTRIPIAEVRFGQIQPTAGLQSGTVQSIQARLYNDSKRFTLTNFAYYLVVQDCIPSKLRDTPPEQCTTVYDQRRRGIPIEIPPNQARDITISIPANPATFSAPFKLLGKPQIELTATEVRAYQSSGITQPTDVSAAK